MLLRVGAESVGGCLGVIVVHPRFARIHGAACVAFFLSFDLVSSPWMDFGVGGVYFRWDLALFFTEVRI